MNAEQRHTVIKSAECDHLGEIESIHDKAGLLFQREKRGIWELWVEGQCLRKTSNPSLENLHQSK